EGAMPYLNACIKEDEKFPWLYLLRGFAIAQLAVTHLNQAKGSVLSDAAAKTREQARQEFGAAEEDLKIALEQLKANPDVNLQYTLLIDRGLIRFQQGDPDKAAADYNEAIRLKKDAAAHTGLAYVLEKQGKPLAAIEQFSQAIAINPTWAPLYRGR